VEVYLLKRGRGYTSVDFSRLFGVPRFLVTKFAVLVCIAYGTMIFRQKIEGRRHFLKFKKSGCLIAANHSLYLDPMIITRATTGKKVFYSAMRDTFDVPFLGTFIRLLGAFPISGRLGLKRIIAPVKRLLGLGRFVLFFPEGFLEHPGWELQEFKSGIFFLACQLRVPVVPLVIISNPREHAGFWESQFVSKVKVVFGEPQYPMNSGEMPPDITNTNPDLQVPLNRGAIKELSDRTWKVMNMILRREYES
jgi:1-acyl-sn-glycerol-3-phosphate acyltransferase